MFQNKVKYVFVLSRLFESPEFHVLLLPYVPDLRFSCSRAHRSPFCWKWKKNCSIRVTRVLFHSLAKHVSAYFLVLFRDGFRIETAYLIFFPNDVQNEYAYILYGNEAFDIVRVGYTYDGMVAKRGIDYS